MARTLLGNTRHLPSNRKPYPMSCEIVPILAAGNESLYELSRQRKNFACPTNDRPTADISKTSATTTPDDTDDNTLSFGDFIDVINPLQHLPIVGSIYRAVTGDTLKPAAQVTGGILYGALTGTGVISGAMVVAEAVWTEHNGNAPLTQIAQAIIGDDDPASTPPALLADNTYPMAIEKYRVAEALYPGDNRRHAAS